mmetsp:Transcript_35454/g.77655  ORF Transcript_35454/g.77655 Transcript_35454/m.77655 type:complete len:402 (-) Transcript_35454:616-1821(-)
MPSTKEDFFRPDAVGLSDPHPHDILLGRGGASNNHLGNKIYRTVVEHNKPLYGAAERHSKQPYAIAIVDAIEARNPPGRFLDHKKKGDGLWYEVTRQRAIDKTAQALREKVHKAKMLPLSEIPEDFAHLVGEESEAIAAATASAAAAAAAKAKKAKGGKKATRTGGKRKKGQNSGSGAGSKAKKVKLSSATTLADPDALVATALRPSTSLFNFFGMFGGGSDQGDAGATAEAAAAVTDNGEGIVSAVAAAAGPSAASSPSSPRKKKKKRRIRTAATVEAKAAIESQEMLRETTLSSDISSFLPSFLERGVTHIMDSLGPPVASLGDRITRCFSSGGSAVDGQGTLVPTLPIPPPTGLKRADTLTGDDDDEEDPAVERLRMIPPSLNGSMSSVGAINDVRPV